MEVKKENNFIERGEKMYIQETKWDRFISAKLGYSQPFFKGQKIGCKVSTYGYPHKLKRSLIVDDCFFIALKYLTSEDIRRGYFGYYRVRAHIENWPEYTIDANSRLFFSV